MASWSAFRAPATPFRNAPFTQQAIQAMLEHLGLDVHGASLRNRNVAAVIVTTDLPPESSRARGSTSPSPRSAMRRR